MSTAAREGIPLNSPNARRLARYLHERTAEAGRMLYVKGKFISEDVDLSPKQIGALMLQLQGAVPNLEIEKWSYTGATTSRVETR
ncbi:hypothetical protein RH858_08330 [Halalkaliarchaeum sp. AArc-GB]|uniref:DUF7123 family protein n=1 Tax=Halalkaliarchaeum sp. AArc-GB TaxID=3074078 RepID=UPI0028598AF7|nr:hypothetical protein [Halalkaliarchaeum sp. AArc-GB]MDR5673155.1 hypothetical protein [Halalkaliarchaeum sp. AArc-GB]